VKLSRFIISALIILAFNAGISAQGTITGIVTGGADSRPLQNAAVILDGIRGVTTGSDGRFIIDRVSAGIHTLEALTARWKNRFVNTGFLARYQGAMWVNDQNIFDEVTGSDRYPAYITIDLRLSRLFWEKLSVDLGVQNILDTRFYDRKGAVCPGRFITLELGYRF